MTSTLRLGFLSPHNPYDRAAFSGTAYYAARALERHPDVTLDILGPHRRRSPLVRKVLQLLPDRPIPAEAFAPDPGLDAVIGVAALHLLDALLAFSSVPMFHVTDATPGFLREFYSEALPQRQDEAERRVISAAACSVYSSHYMAERAKAELGAEAGKLDVVPFGVNMDSLPEAVLEKPSLDRLNLLFIAKDWTRKGGDIALEAFATLRANGVDAQLTLIGATPEGTLPPGVEALGFLDKNTPSGLARITRAFTDAHLLVLPTRADCTPMVVAEANAHAAPVLITDTGGIGTLMSEGENGVMLPLEAGAADWAAAINRLTADRDGYLRMSRSSFAHAGHRLTWDAWADDIVRLARDAALKRSAA